MLPNPPIGADILDNFIRLARFAVAAPPQRSFNRLPVGATEVFAPIAMKLRPGRKP
jgi:hypothetical protein